MEVKDMKHYESNTTSCQFFQNTYLIESEMNDLTYLIEAEMNVLSKPINTFPALPSVKISFQKIT